jgi:3,4-dihydroxy 2-butanone 4-phosphate synthase/GTP cyclohydrolase II
MAGRKVMTAKALTSPRTDSGIIAAPSIGRGFAFARPAALIEATRRGRPVILCDDEDRENEGDLVFAAQFASPKLVTQMIREAGGLICVALAPSLIRQFRLRPMVAKNQCPKGTAFTVSVDAAHGVTTGISARDRAHTIRLLGDTGSGPRDFAAPGHIFPLAARAGLLGERQGHTEASVTLACYADLTPAAAICEILDSKGEAMRRDALFAFARRHDLRMGTVAELSAWSGIGHC